MMMMKVGWPCRSQSKKCTQHCKRCYSVSTTRRSAVQLHFPSVLESCNNPGAVTGVQAAVGACAQ